MYPSNSWHVDVREKLIFIRLYESTLTTRYELTSTSILRKESEFHISVSNSVLSDMCHVSHNFANKSDGLGYILFKLTHCYHIPGRYELTLDSFTYSVRLLLTGVVKIYSNYAILKLWNFVKQVYRTFPLRRWTKATKCFGKLQKPHTVITCLSLLFTQIVRTTKVRSNFYQQIKRKHLLEN